MTFVRTDLQRCSSIYTSQSPISIIICNTRAEAVSCSAAMSVVVPGMWLLGTLQLWIAFTKGTFAEVTEEEIFPRHSWVVLWLVPPQSEPFLLQMPRFVATDNPCGVRGGGLQWLVRIVNRWCLNLTWILNFVGVFRKTKLHRFFFSPEWSPKI